MPVTLTTRLPAPAAASPAAGPPDPADAAARPILAAALGGGPAGHARLRGAAEPDTLRSWAGADRYPWDQTESWLERFPEALDDPDPACISTGLSEHTVLSLVGARGGIGASCLVLHLAWAIRAAGHSVAVVDLDPVGCGGLILGSQLLGGLRWADLGEEETAYRPRALARSLPTWHEVPILTTDQRGGLPDRASQLAVIEALAREHELVLIDQLRTQDAYHGTWPLLVTGLDAVSVMAAQILAPELRSHTGHPLALAVRGTGEDVDAEYLNWSLGAPVLGEIPQDRGIAQRVARGDDLTRTRGGAARAVLNLAQAVMETYLDVDGPGLGHALHPPQQAGLAPGELSEEEPGAQEPGVEGPGEIPGHGAPGEAAPW